MNRKTSNLCRLSDLADPGSKGFVVKKDGKKVAVFVVRRGDEVFGYVNDCPHLHMPLEFVPDQFLDVGKRTILCASHGALFKIETGTCVHGPCIGKGLTPFPVVLRDGKVYREES